MNKDPMTYPQKALLVIDIQEDYTGSTARPPFPYKDADKLIGSVNKVIQKATEQNILMVYIRQEFEGIFGRLFSKIFSGGTAIKGRPGTEIDKRIDIKSAHLFTKPEANAFSNAGLGVFLEEQKVGSLYLTGLDAWYCVFSTAKAGKKLGYEVSIIKDAIALKAENKWVEILDKYKQAGIRVVRVEEVF